MHFSGPLILGNVHYHQRLAQILQVCIYLAHEWSQGILKIWEFKYNGLFDIDPASNRLSQYRSKLQKLTLELEIPVRLDWIVRRRMGHSGCIHEVEQYRTFQEKRGAQNKIHSKKVTEEECTIKYKGWIRDTNWWGSNEENQERFSQLQSFGAGHRKNSRDYHRRQEIKSLTTIKWVQTEGELAISPAFRPINCKTHFLDEKLH